MHSDTKAGWLVVGVFAVGLVLVGVLFLVFDR